jgi:BolA family transcriptional regulator, general stress-responsive regulator
VSSRVEQIQARLSDAFAPLHLEVVDDSARHAGHAGAAGGAGHFQVRIVSGRFRGLSLLARHRLVYEALRPLLEVQIHALNIEAHAPGERASDANPVNS